MKRFLAISLAVSAIALGLGACDWESGNGRLNRGSGRYTRAYYDPCRQFDTCSTCTPVLGCGWCSTGTRGACVSAPDECAGADQFSWTWESAYCPAAKDAGLDGADAGPGLDGDDAGTADAGSADAGVD